MPLLKPVVTVIAAEGLVGGSAEGAGLDGAVVAEARPSSGTWS